MKIDIDNTFIRYGRMHIVRQDGYGKESFHAPPAPIGFYAMPIRFQELFLIGSIDKTQPDQLAIPKKFKNRGENFDYHEYDKIIRKKYKKIIHKFVVKNDEYVWHHLTVKQNVIIDNYGDWVKTSVRDWKIALSKESLTLRAQSMGSYSYENVPASKNKFSFSEVRPKTGVYSKDHFEVFFDSKVY